MAKKGPKMRLLARIGGFDVWEVNGAAIRKDIDPDFTNFGHHLSFDFIPEHEFWIDMLSNHELGFFVAHLLAEHRAMATGASYDEALKLGDRAEAAERFKSRTYREAKNRSESATDAIYVDPIASFGDVRVWLVDGERVRDLLFVDFTEGGHGYVYDFIPNDEIWIDDAVSSEERLYIIAHEFLERKIMIEGRSYNSAHKAATKVEWMMRNEP